MNIVFFYLRIGAIGIGNGKFYRIYAGSSIAYQGIGFRAAGRRSPMEDP